MEFISLTIIYGLLAALTWGAGDFSGGMAAKRMNPLVVVFQAQLVGISILTVLALITSESISVDSIGWSLVAGLFGGIGILFLYHSLAIQKMGIAAPISALVSSAIPIAVSYFVEGALEVVQIMGVGLALFAIILLSVDRSNVAISLEIIKYPIISGVGFGLFFVLIDKSASRSVFLPLVFARLASVIFLFVLINKNDTITGFKLPERRNLGIKVSLAGILDSLGNAFFILAAQRGRLDIAAVISSLYPVSTVFLAYIILKEKLTRLQMMGSILALLGIVLIALGSSK